MNISNNDIEMPYDMISTEWTMTRGGATSDGFYFANHITTYGDVSADSVDFHFAVRPVFYLTTDVTISGDGTIDNPFIVN